ncbi:MAG TPA: type II secretion system F family protein [Geminicoccaceae bacterium]|nr:type II secretion system F family protein [Geminicoccaceae bacterium]
MLNLGIQQLVYLGLLFAAVVLAIVGVSMVFTRASDVKLRVKVLGEADAAGFGAAAGRWQRRLAELLRPVARLAQSSEADDASRIRSKFMQAGWRSSAAPSIFFGLKTLLALFLPMLGLAFIQLFSIRLEGHTPAVVLLLLAAIGYYLPNIVLRARTAERKREIFEAFPDATDLIIVCIEAGLGTEMAIARTAREMQLRSKALAEEMDLIGVELRMGASRERALRNFAARTGVDEVSMFVAMVLQADRFGTSIGDALRVHAEELRLRRRLKAEEQAAKIPLKLLFPLIFGIFPALLLVLLGPAFIQIYRTFVPIAGGG